VASGAYIKRMSNYCANCKYKPEVKTGADACPVTTLYWHFLIKHYAVFASNPRTALMTRNVDRFNADDVSAIQQSAEKVLNNLDSL
jgi:deoxyribodipyrimidine photolyase-related protein